MGTRARKAGKKDPWLWHVPHEGGQDTPKEAKDSQWTPSCQAGPLRDVADIGASDSKVRKALRTFNPGQLFRGGSPPVSGWRSENFL